MFMYGNHRPPNTRSTDSGCPPEKNRDAANLAELARKKHEQDLADLEWERERSEREQAK